MLIQEEIEKVKRAIMQKPNYVGKYYTGNKLKRKRKTKLKVSAKQRREDHLSIGERKKLYGLKGEVVELFNLSSKITKSAEKGGELNKETKKDFKKGGELGAVGIWSLNTYKTYSKRCKTLVKYCIERFQLERLSDLKPDMVTSFIEDQKAKGNSAKTIGNYISALKKMVEAASCSADGEKNPLGELLNTYNLSLKPRYSKKDRRRGKKDGYTLREAQILAKRAGDFSKYHQAMVETLTYGGPRVEELLKIKWRQFDYETNRMYMTDPNQNKNGRPRFIEVPQKTMDKLKEIWASGLAGTNPDTRVWGSKFSEDAVRGFIRECCRLGKVGYSGVHDFRRAMIEYLEKQLKKGRFSREEIADRILTHVNVVGINPMEVKKKKVYYTAQNGQKLSKLEPILNEKGKPLWAPRFSKIELLQKSDKRLIKAYQAQVLGHNRESSVNPYLRG